MTFTHLEKKVNKPQDIWRRQMSLNERVGVFPCSFTLPERDEWIKRYGLAGLMECVEAIDNTYWKWWVSEVKNNPDLQDTLRSKEALALELIDILHMLVSLFQSYGLTETDFIDNWECAVEDWQDSPANQVDLNVKPLLTGLASAFASTAAGAAWAVKLDMLETLLCACFWLGLSEDQIYQLYVLKNDVNHRRQDSNYSLSGKTEADNLVLETTVRQWFQKG